MRRKEKEIIDSKEIASILQEAVVCRLGLMEDDYPYIVPMNFACQGNFLYLHAASEGKKINILKKNNHVCFEVDIKTELVQGEKPCNWSMKYYSVIGRGKASLEELIEKKVEALNIIMEKYAGNQNYHYPEHVLDKVVVIKVEIEELTGKKSGY